MSDVPAGGPWLRASDVASRWGCHRSYVATLADRHGVRTNALVRERRYSAADVDRVAALMRAMAGGPELPPVDLLVRHWRVGASWGLTIVADGVELPTDDPEHPYRREDDVLLGMMRDPEVARHIVEVHNAWLERERPEDEDEPDA